MMPTTIGLPSRRGILRCGASAAAILAAPAIIRAQTRELVVGGAAGHKEWVDEIVVPAFEKKHKAKIIFEGTRSLVNLEKMQKNKGRQYMSVVQMDDPVMILAVREGLLDPLTPARTPNLAELNPGTVHMDGMWANYLQPWLGIAYNTTAMKMPPTSWADLWEPKLKGRVILPSLQNTEGLASVYAASALGTGKPFSGKGPDLDATFGKLAALKPNLLTIYTQQPQAFNLLEQGEAWMIGSAQASYGLLRKAAGAPIDVVAPKEGVFALPSGIAVIKGAPQPELAFAYVDELLGAELQQKLVGPTFSLATNKGVKRPSALPANLVIHPIDWAEVARDREGWVKRWDRDMAI